MPSLFSRKSLCLLTLVLTTATGCKAAAEKKTDEGAPPSAATAQPSGTSAPAPQTAAPGTPGQAPPPGAPGQPAAPAATPIVPSGPSTQVVARVNGQAITRGELDFTIRNVIGETAPADRHAEIRKQVLDGMINQELILQKAKTAKIVLPETELADQMKKLKSQFPDEKAYADQITKDGLTPALVEGMVRKAMIIDQYIKTNLVAKASVTPEEEQKFYSENTSKMKKAEQIRASHILLKVEQNSTEAQKSAQKAKAEEALARAKKGEDFSVLAKQYSQDPGSAQSGGDLNYFGRGQMVPAFETAAWALKTGEVSNVVESPFGYHIIKVTDRKAESTVPLAEAKDKIHQFLASQKVQAEIQRLQTEMKSSAKIEITL